MTIILVALGLALIFSSYLGQFYWRKWKNEERSSKSWLGLISEYNKKLTTIQKDHDFYRDEYHRLNKELLSSREKHAITFNELEKLRVNLAALLKERNYCLDQYTEVSNPLAVPGLSVSQGSMDRLRKYITKDRLARTTASGHKKKKPISGTGPIAKKRATRAVAGRRKIRVNPPVRK